MKRSDFMTLYCIASSRGLMEWHVTAALVLYSVNGMESAVAYLNDCPSPAPEQASLFPQPA